MPARAVLQYSRDGFDTRVGEMMGRRMAGETFLKAWITHADADPLTAWVHSQAEAHAFETQARELGATVPIAIAEAARFGPLMEAGALWLADPAVARHAWQRRWFRQNAWSIVGITHTISSHAALDLIADLLIAPVQPWDALICTSRAVRKVVENLLNHQAAYLAERVGATACLGPELPIIPLGVACDNFVPASGVREKWRNTLGIKDDDIAVLHFGRLSLHLKAHPQPLYLALKLAGQRGRRRFHLILAGQPTNPQQKEAMHGLAARFADCVTTHFVDGALADAGEVRAAADIFSLLSDNIQESFGLAPVEAMAAGLPVVGSDWDGLRDTIEHGVTGFLIESTMPERGIGELIARRHALGLQDYHHYVASIAQVTAIDVAQAADAFATLAADTELRRTMGRAGRKRALAMFDWSRVIRAYRDLLDQLRGIRAAAAERVPRRPNMPAQPARMDPFALFEAYPTHRIGSSTVLTLAGVGECIADLSGGFDDAILVQANLPEAAVIDATLARLADGPMPLSELVKSFPEHDVRLLMNGAAWLLKFGLVRRL